MIEYDMSFVYKRKLFFVNKLVFIVLMSILVIMF